MSLQLTISDVVKMDSYGRKLIDAIKKKNIKGKRETARFRQVLGYLKFNEFADNNFICGKNRGMFIHTIKRNKSGKLSQNTPVLPQVIAIQEIS